MKRRELIRRLERFGCVLAEERAKHSKYVNLAPGSKINQSKSAVQIFILTF